MQAPPLPPLRPSSSPPSHTPRLPNPELLALLSGTSLSGPPCGATLPRLRTRGLNNQGNMYFTNAVLQLLAHCPPFWNLFNHLGQLTGQRGQGEGQQTSGSTTLLVDATDHGSAASDIMVPTAGRPALLPRYLLHGVVYHHGTSASGGHYTVDVLHPNAHEGSGEAWLRIDDDIVSTVRHEEVFLRHDNERMDDRCAYLLIYRHTAHAQT